MASAFHLNITFPICQTEMLTCAPVKWSVIFALRDFLHHISMNKSGRYSLGLVWRWRRLGGQSVGHSFWAVGGNRTIVGQKYVEWDIGKLYSFTTAATLQLICLSILKEVIHKTRIFFKIGNWLREFEKENHLVYR